MQAGEEKVGRKEGKQEEERKKIKLKEKSAKEREWRRQ
jgi:hypothetical protein